MLDAVMRKLTGSLSWKTRIIGLIIWAVLVACIVQIPAVAERMKHMGAAW